MAASLETMINRSSASSGWCGEGCSTRLGAPRRMATTITPNRLGRASSTRLRPTMAGGMASSVRCRSSPSGMSEMTCRLISRLAKRRPNSSSGLTTRCAPTSWRMRRCMGLLARPITQGEPIWRSRAVQMIDASLESSPMAHTAQSRRAGCSRASSLSSVASSARASVTKAAASSTRGLSRSTARTSAPFSESVRASDMPNWPRPMMSTCWDMGNL